MTSKALVTGAGGFIGSHLVERLAETGQRVTAVDVDLGVIQHLRGRSDVTLVNTDIRELDAMARLLEGVDVVFHLAAAHLDVLKDESYYRSVNVDAVVALASLAAAAGVRKFVHCSSVGVYGSLAEVPADETTTCRPDIVYERTKLAGEQAVIDVVRSTGISAVIFRPSWVYGPGCPRTIKLIRSVVNRRFFYAGGGENLRHPIFIDDLLEAFEMAAASELPSAEILIVAGPKAVTTRELVTTILEIAQSPFRPRVIPFWLAAAGCHVLEKTCAMVGRRPPFSARSLKFFSESSAFSVEKARRLLGFEPRVSLEDGLTKTIDYGREHQLL